MPDVDLFLPPSPADYDNVAALNRAWLAGAAGLKACERERLARCPFLLFSLKEQNIDWWGAALSEQRPLSTGSADRELIAAAVGFMWGLADRNPYAARLVSGASVAWCELVTSRPLVDVIDRVAGREDLLDSRLEARGLTDDGVSSHARVRRATHLTALQMLLTNAPGPGYRELKTAACRLTKPGLQVAEKKK